MAIELSITLEIADDVEPALIPLYLSEAGRIASRIIADKGIPDVDECILMSNDGDAVVVRLNRHE